MAVTKNDVRDFIRFADERIENGGAGSLVELAREGDAQGCARTKATIISALRPIGLSPSSFAQRIIPGRQPAASHGDVNDLPGICHRQLPAIRPPPWPVRPKCEHGSSAVFARPCEANSRSFERSRHWLIPRISPVRSTAIRGLAGTRPVS